MGVVGHYAELRKVVIHEGRDSMSSLGASTPPAQQARDSCDNGRWENAKTHHSLPSTLFIEVNQQVAARIFHNTTQHTHNIHRAPEPHANSAALNYSPDDVV